MNVDDNSFSVVNMKESLSDLEKENKSEFDMEDDSMVDSNGSAMFSRSQEASFKDHELKMKAFDAVNKDSTSSDAKKHPSLINRRHSFIELPQNLNDKLAPLLSKLSSESSNSFEASSQGEITNELLEICSNLQLCLDLRHKYLDQSIQLNELDNPKNKDTWNIYPKPPKPTYKSKNRFNQIPSTNEEEEFVFEHCEIPEATSEYTVTKNPDGTFIVTDTTNDVPVIEPVSLHDYYSDLVKINRFSSDGPAKSFSYRRLSYLEARWNMYTLLNDYAESAISKRNPHRDFYNVRKVDTHIHHSACMNQKHLLRFIKYKLKTEPEKQVIFRDGKILTLSEVFKSLNLTGYDLSIDTLDMHAHKDTFHRFDKFNLKYNPIGESRLREIFLKTDNFINGTYLAELTRQVMDDLEASKYQMIELRISIYGRSTDEWDKLAKWVINNKLFSHNVRWLIQVPRLYDLYKQNNNVETFSAFINNIFEPLFEVSINPKSHPELHVFLQRVIGFDSVDDESKSEKLIQSRHYPPANLWDSSYNPPYSYYIYYLYANLTSLNNLRVRLGYNTLVLRPHCGEAGDTEHLISAFLTSHSISHGIVLRKIPFIQYLYYLDQIGLAMSPLSNNALFLTYDKNPFHSFFKKGLNVSLSTDDPLQFSYTKEPLIEEYSVATQIYKLSPVDMCELAANSVRQSGWENTIKMHWLGKEYMHRGIKGNNLEKTNIPDIRIAYRHETLTGELDMIKHYSTMKDSYN